MRASRRLILAAPALLARPARAQAAWTIGTEYPANAMPGEGIAFFAKDATERSGGSLTVTAAPSVVQRRLSSAVTVSTRIFPGTSSARLRRSSGVMGPAARNAR